MNKAIIAVVGEDTVGIIAKVYTYLAGNQINILDISQTVVQDYFNIMMIVDMGTITKSFGLVSEELERAGEEADVKVKIQKEDISTKMRRIWFRFRHKPATRRSQDSAESLIRKGQQDIVNIYEVGETNNMIEHEKLDVHTITLGISLLDCVDSDLDWVDKNIYHKITTLAKDLVAMGRDIERDLGIPIVSERISVIPISLVGGTTYKCPEGFVTIVKTLDKAAKEVGVNFIGGYSALVGRDMTAAERNLVLSIPQAFAKAERICNSINMGSIKTELNMGAVELIGRIVKGTAETTKDNDSLGCAKLVIFCNIPDGNPFMAGAFHGIIETDAIISVGVSGPGVVKVALEEARGENFEVLYGAIKKTTFKVTRVGQLMAQEASRRMGIPFGITDLSLAPTPSVGDSVAEILEEIGLERVEAPGTTAALTMLNDQVKKGGIVTSSCVGGLSGVFIPVSKDQRVIDAIGLGALILERLEAVTCMCSVGLDMIAIPGNTPSATIAGIIADGAATGMTNQKTTAMRLIPVTDKKVGDTAKFGGLLGYASVISVNTFSCKKFATRGERIPAPIHSFKN